MPVFDCADSDQLLTGMREAKQAIAMGSVVVLPTDTVYGIGCDAFSASAVNKLLSTKGRDRQSPPPVLIKDASVMQALAEYVPEVASQLAEEFWPGALTIILRTQPSLNWDLGETKQTVALRVPDHKIALALLAETGPLAVSSANLTGQPAATTAAQALDYFGEQVGIYLDSGASPKGEASTILDLTGIAPNGEGSIRVVRIGALSVERIKAIVGDKLAD
ncbi:MAG: L-threonylcarbamoyladenylate synthase [Micrococcales bacterium]